MEGKCIDVWLPLKPTNVSFYRFTAVQQYGYYLLCSTHPLDLDNLMLRIFNDLTDDQNKIVDIDCHHFYIFIRL